MSRMVGILAAVVVDTRPTLRRARVSRGWVGVRIRRSSYEVRAVCANQRTYKSGRGGPGDQHHYRKRYLLVEWQCEH